MQRNLLLELLEDGERVSLYSPKFEGEEMTEFEKFITEFQVTHLSDLQQIVHRLDMIKQFGLSKSILHKLMLYASVAQKNEQRKAEGKAQDYSYLWHASYYLTRYIKRYDKNRVVVDFVKNLRDKEITLNGGQNLQLIALAARWAELQLREFEQE